MLEILGALVSGGATGLLGSAVSAFTKFKLQKLQNDFEIAKIEKETEQMRMEQETRMAVADIEATTKKETSADSLVEASYAHDTAAYATGTKARDSKAFIFLDFVRGMVRPLLTIYLMVLSTWLTVEVFSILNGLENAISAEQAYTLVQQAIATILYLTSTIVLWWFGTRNKLFVSN